MVQGDRRIREPAMNRSEIGQVGPIMKQLGISNVKKLPVVLGDNMEISTGNDGEDFVAVDYTVDGREHHAEIINDDGIIRCIFCGPVSEKVTWCKHVYQAVVARKDGILFSKPGRYLIPVVPTDGIYCPVHLEQIQLGTTSSKEFYSVTFKLAPRDEKGNVDGTEYHDINIGYVPKNHVCINDLRSMMAHWLVGNMHDTRFYAPVKCQGPEHESVKHNTSVFTDTFYESMYGLCLGCINNQLARLAEMDAKKNNYKSDAPVF